MICPNCGLFNAEEATFCNHCGNRLQGAGILYPQNFQNFPPQQIIYPPMQTPQKSHTGLIVGIVIGSIVFIAAIFAVLYFAVFRNMPFMGGFSESGSMPFIQDFSDDGTEYGPGEETLPYNDSSGIIDGSDMVNPSIVGQWYDSSSGDSIVFRDDGTLSWSMAFGTSEAVYEYDSAQAEGLITLTDELGTTYHQFTIENSMLNVWRLEDGYPFSEEGLFSKISD